ncbi:MAG: polysaccharide lyase family 8 super-sandwich domain-containing protein, partial [Fibrobacterota bacterium]
MPKSFVFLIFAIAAFLPVRASASDIDTLRANVTNYLTATGADTTDPIVAQALTDLETSARSYMIACLPRGGWPDINYAAALAVSPWPAMNHYSRMRTMALAYTTRGQGLFQSDSLCNAIELALDSIHDHVYSGVSLVNNYWYWLQGLPYTYGQTLVLLEGKVDSTLFAQAAATMTWFFTHPNADTWGAPGDAINVALGRLYYGVISGSTAALSKAYSLAKKEFGSLISGDGIYPDFSAVHHQTQLYIGAYGAQIAADGPRYQLFTRGTAYALGASELSKLNGFIAEATAWCLYDKYYDPSVIGRTITRVSSNGLDGLTGLVLMASQSGPYQTFLQRVSKRMLESWFSQLPAEIASLASDIYKTSETAAWPNGYKNFFSTYFSVHRGPNYYMSVKMMGPGIQSSEQINGEGLKSWHLSDGLTYIFRSGEEYYTHHVFPTLDWNRMPGTTIQKKYYAPMGLDTRGAINNNPFVGGVECGRYGASAMDFSSSFQALTAKKSWFFFDDAMVCLGSDITCPTTDTAETIVNQRPLSANGLPLIVNGSTVTSALGWSGKIADASWAACDSMGYYFPGGCELSAKAVTQTGRWRSIGSGDTTLHSNPMLTLWINHGINAAGADYAYAVLPNKSAADMAAYAATPGVHVVANNDTLQAVENTPLNALGAVFWKPGICGIVQADSPCVAFWRTTPDSLYFSATYPPHTQPTIHFTLNDPLTLLNSSKTITVSTDSITTSVSFVSEQGKTMQATFRRIHKVFGYVRVTVTDSVSNNPVAGASCTVRKAYSVSDITDSLGRIVLKTDTGANQVAVRKFSWRTAYVAPVPVLPGETTEVALSMVKYTLSGIRLFPDTLVLGLLDTGAFKVLGLYPDSSVDTLSETFAWTLLPDTLAGVSPAGQVTTGLYAG